MTEIDDRPTLAGMHLPTVQQLAAAVAIPRLELWVEREAGRDVARTSVLEGDVLRVGSHPSNDVVLDDRAVSRFHFQLTRSDQGWLVSDSGSLNGTTVNGVRVRDADLPRPGCRIELGDSVLRLQELGPEAIEEIPTWSSFGDLYGESMAMRQLFAVLDRVAKSESTVLIEGESGTGKELAAMEIARRGPRSSGPFIIVDCSSISPNLIESELFGHERGAFTGAVATRQGAFETAGKGTVFLDEVGELPLDVQPKLLRVLENGEFRRVGGNKTMKANARIVAATKRNLKDEVERGKFREDLYFRLAVVPIHVPALRQRREDIPMLVGHFLELAKKRDPNAAEVRLTKDTVAALSAHDWPGNVRELRNVLDRAIYIATASGEKDLRLVDLPVSAPHRQGGPQAFAFAAGESYRDVKARYETEFEKSFVAWLLERHAGNISAAAREAKMDRKHLYDLARKHGLRG